MRDLSSARAKDGDTQPADATGSEIQLPTKRPPRSAAERLRIVEEYDSYAPGAPERGAILRREGIYTSQISKWRKLRTKGALAALTAQAPGPKPTASQPLPAEVDRLRKENARLHARLAQAETIIDVQKKLPRCLGPIRRSVHWTNCDAAGDHPARAAPWRQSCLPGLGCAAQRLLPRLFATC